MEDLEFLFGKKITCESCRYFNAYYMKLDDVYYPTGEGRCLVRKTDRLNGLVKKDRACCYLWRAEPEEEK